MSDPYTPEVLWVKTFMKYASIINVILMTLKNRLRMKVHKLNLGNPTCFVSSVHLVNFILTINTISAEYSLNIESKYGITKVSPHI